MSGELTTAGDADVEGPADNDVSEDTPLLSRQQSGGGWKKPRGFIWIEIGRHFVMYVLHAWFC